MLQLPHQKCHSRYQPSNKVRKHYVVDKIDNLYQPTSLQKLWNLVCLLCKHSHKLIHMYTPQLDYREVGSYSLIYYYLLLPLLSDFALGAKGQQMSFYFTIVIKKLPSTCCAQTPYWLLMICGSEHDMAFTLIMIIFKGQATKQYCIRKFDGF